MSDTASLKRKINSAEELQSVVRTMKALAASNIGQYEQSVRALADYYRTVELGLNVCLRGSSPIAGGGEGRPAKNVVSAIVFGSDQGLVGQFNEVVADYALNALSALPGNAQVWAVGERVHARLADADLQMVGFFAVPNSVKAITPLVGQILVESEMYQNPSASLRTSPSADSSVMFSTGQDEITELHLFYNRPMSASIYTPVSQRLLPLDETWRRNLAERAWPTKNLPEVMGEGATTLPALISEYLFVSLFRACAESLASENAARLAAMERADKNIDELLENFHFTYHQLRQSGIDEELFDVISGYEALAKGKAL